MLISSKNLLLQAKDKNFACPHFNFWDSNSIRAEIAAAESMNLPVILAWAQKHSPEINMQDALALGKYFGAKANVPVVLHLDHGTDVQTIKYGIINGFTSVMIDASDKTFEENVKVTKDVVDFAHQRGVVVEAEIGHVGTNSTKDNSLYTEVAPAKKFQEETECDSLAISIGTSHGVYKTSEPPKLNFERLVEINRKIDIPLVLHGGSSSGDQNLTKCAEKGITKVNIYTDLANEAVRSVTAKNFSSEPEMGCYQRKQIQQLAEHYYRILKTTKYSY